MQITSLKAALLGGVIASGALALGPAQAAPILGGITEVRLDAAPVLDSLDIAVGLLGTAQLLGTPEISPGVPVPLVGFPITGGTANGNLSIEHDGSGLSLTRDTNGVAAGGVVVVSLENFVIDTATLLLSGLVSVDGSALGIVPLFSISGSGNATYPFLLSLTAGAAGALNGSLGVTAFSSGLGIALAATSPEVGADVAVPVPATALLFGAAIAPLLAARRRRTA
jgi:hypothetical protein